MAKQQPTATNKGAPAPVTELAHRPATATADLTRIDKLAERYAFGQLVASGNGDSNRLATALRENLGGGSVSAFDFQRIKVPPGGAVAWEVVDPDTGEPTYSKDVTGVLVFWTDQKAYWKQGLDDKGAQRTPPNCYSPDTVRGIGDPGVACATCSFNQFGTAKGGTAKGKACKDVRHLLICRPEDALPILLPAPPTSIKAMRQYFLDLAGRSIPYWAAVTEFKLTKKSSGGNDYGVIVPRLVGILDGAAYADAQRFSETVRKLLGKTRLTERADVEGEQTAAGVTVNGQPATPAGAGYAGGDALGDDDMPGSTDDDAVDAETQPAKTAGAANP